MKIAELVFSTSRRDARSAYHDKYPRDFGPQIAYTESLALDTSCPRSCREGENCRSLGPMRQIPFIHPTLCRSHARFNFYIKMSRWLDIGRVRVEVHKNVKRERGQYQAISTELAWSIKDLLYGIKSAEKNDLLTCLFSSTEKEPS